MLLLWRAGTLADWYFQTVEWPRLWATRGDRHVLLRVLDSLVVLPRATLPLTALATLAILGARRFGDTSVWNLAVGLAGVLAAVFALHAPPALWFGLMYLWSVAMPVALLVYVASLGVASLRARSRVTELPMAVFAGALVGLASWLQCFPVPCPQHRFWAVAPAIGIAVYVVWWGTGHRTLATATIVVAFMLPTAVAQLESARAKLLAPRVAIEGIGALAGMRAPAPQAAEWQRLGDALAREVRRRPDVPMLVAGKQALFGALVANTENPGPFFVDWKMPGQDLVPVRSRFVRTLHPLVFLEDRTVSGLGPVLDEGGYAAIYSGPWGTLLVPTQHDKPAGDSGR